MNCKWQVQKNTKLLLYQELCNQSYIIATIQLILLSSNDSQSLFDITGRRCFYYYQWKKWANKIGNNGSASTSRTISIAKAGAAAGTATADDDAALQQQIGMMGYQIGLGKSNSSHVYRYSNKARRLMNLNLLTTQKRGAYMNPLRIFSVSTPVDLLLMKEQTPYLAWVKN